MFATLLVLVGPDITTSNAPGTTVGAGTKVRVVSTYNEQSLGTKLLPEVSVTVSTAAKAGIVKKLAVSARMAVITAQD